MGVLRGLSVLVIVTFTSTSGGASAAPVPSPPPVSAPVLAPAAPPPAVPTPAAPPAAAPVPAPAEPPAPVRQRPAPTLAVGTPCSAAARACADLSRSRAWLIRDGVVEYGPVPIVHGRKGFRTPPGTFRVTFKDRDHVSSLYDDARMPNSVFFNGDIAFHQGPLRGGSHGCVRLSKAASQAFFSALNRGDVVQVVR